MSPEDLRPLLNARPLIPFRLHLDDGRTFDVQHPDLLWLGNRKSLLEQDVHLSLLHTVGAEPLAGAASS